MRVWPIILDASPAYLGRGSRTPSLLTTAIGAELLGTLICRDVSRIAAHAPTIVAPAHAPAGYRASLAAICPPATIVLSSADLTAVLMGVEAADLLLFVDARYAAVDASAYQALVHEADDTPGLARHLIVHAGHLAGTRENVNLDGNGFVHSVHRYYRPTAWPFIAGVAASLVPSATGLLPLQGLPGSLQDLRQSLVAGGVPSRDIALAGGVFDFREEHGILAAMERAVPQAPGGGSDRPATTLVGSGQQIDATARLVGPVVVHADARVEAGATIVGPVVIGAGAVVSAGALVAHANVGAGAVVPPGAVVRDRVWTAASVDAGMAVAPEPRLNSFTERLARYNIDAADAEVTETVARPGGTVYPAVKRAVDLTVAALALVLLSPLLLVVAAIVWVDSKGNVFFRHTREGLGGRLFDCLKFRTMRPGTDALQRTLKQQDKLDGPHFKLDADPRITRMGHWLRASNLDELPQLFNVLTGDMSLVGPRPSPFRENQICVPWRAGRLSVRPGITGLWQVCRQDRAAGDFHQWIEYDLLYVQHLGLRLDLKLVAATVLTLGGKYPVPVSWLLRLPASRPVRLVPVASAEGPAPDAALSPAKRPAGSIQ